MARFMPYSVRDEAKSPPLPPAGLKNQYCRMVSKILYFQVVLFNTQISEDT